MFEVRPVCDCSRRGTECSKDDGQEGCDRKKHAKGAHLIKKSLSTGPKHENEFESLLGYAGSWFHLSNPVPPSRQLSHLSQNILLGLLPVHPSRIHRSLDQFLELLLKRQKFPVDIRAVDTVRVVRVLSSVLFVRFHRHSTALTARSQRHNSNSNKHADKN